MGLLRIGTAAEARTLLRARWRLWRLRRSLRVLRRLEAQDRAAAASIEAQERSEEAVRAHYSFALQEISASNARLQAQSQMANNPYVQQVLAQNAANAAARSPAYFDMANSPTAAAYNRAFAECTCNGSIIYDAERDELRPARRCPLHG